MIGCGLALETLQARFISGTGPHGNVILIGTFCLFFVYYLINIYITYRNVVYVRLNLKAGQFGHD